GVGVGGADKSGGGTRCSGGGGGGGRFGGGGGGGGGGFFCSISTFTAFVSWNMSVSASNLCRIAIAPSEMTMRAARPSEISRRRTMALPFARKFSEDTDFDEAFFLKLAHDVDDVAVIRALIRAHENAGFSVDVARVQRRIVG